MYSHHNTLAVLRAPEKPLFCRRLDEMPLPPFPGVVYDLDGQLYQQTHPAIVMLGRSQRGPRMSPNIMLKGLLERLYGYDEMFRTLARGVVSYGEDECINSVAEGSLIITPFDVLRDDCQDLVFLRCRSLNLVDYQSLPNLEPETDREVKPEAESRRPRGNKQGDGGKK